MLIIFNVEPLIVDSIGNGILQCWLRVGIRELFLVSTDSPLLITMVALLVPLGTFIPLLPLLLHPSGFIVTYALTYISSAIEPMIPNCPGKLILITVETKNTVVVPYFAKGVN